MESMRDSFIFYRSFYEALVKMDKESQAECLMALADYTLNGNEPKDLSPVGNLFFALIKPQLDANNKKYENGCKGAPFGKLGGRPKKVVDENPKKPLKNPNQTPNENENDNVNENVIKEKIYKKENDKIKNSMNMISALRDHFTGDDKSKILIDGNFSVFDVDDPDFKIYRRTYGDKICIELDKWLKKNKYLQKIDKSFILKQFTNFSNRQNLS